MKTMKMSTKMKTMRIFSMPTNTNCGIESGSRMTIAIEMAGQ